MTFRCERCHTLLDAESVETGEVVECPRCGQAITVPQTVKIDRDALRAQLRNMSTSGKSAARQHASGAAQSESVVLTDVDVPFTSILFVCLKVLGAMLLIYLPFLLLWGMIIGCEAATRPSF